MEITAPGERTPWLKGQLYGNTAVIEWPKGHVYGDSFQLSNGKTMARKLLQSRRVKVVGIHAVEGRILALTFAVG